MQRNSKFLSYVSNLQLRDEFPQDEVSLIISEYLYLKTPAKDLSGKQNSWAKTK